jgi:WD40 repeat protein
MSDLFISYSRKDKEFVRRLDEALKRREREAWVDWEGIRPTEEFMGAIYGAIEAADTFVFVLTSDSISSTVCGLEIAHAAKHNKRLVPIVSRDVDASKVPEELARLNWILCRESDDFEAAVETLVTALDTDLDWIRAHTRLLTRAIEWQAKSSNNSFVLRGDDLREAERWLTEAGTDKERQPTPLQTEYIIASRRAATRRQRITLGAVTFGAVVAIVLAILALNQRTKALQTLSRSYFQEACRLIDEDRATVALAYLARAAQSDPKNRPATVRLLALLAERNWILPLTEPLPHDSPVVSVRFSPDGSKLLTEAGNMGGFGTVRVWEATTGKPLSPPLQQEYRFTRGCFSPSGQFVATWSNSRPGEQGPCANVWRTEGTSVAEKIEAQSARFVMDDEHLAVMVNDEAGSEDQSQFSIGDGVSLLGTDLLARGRGPVSNNADSDRSADRTAVRLWKIGSPLQPLEFPSDPATERFIEFSPSGAAFLKLAADGTLLLCRTSGSAPSVSLRKRSARTTAFFADEETIVTLMQDEAGSGNQAAPQPVQLELWSAKSGKRFGGQMLATTLEERVTNLAFNADKTRAHIVLTASQDQEIRSSLALLDLVQERELWRVPVNAPVQAAFSSSDEDLVLFTGGQVLPSGGEDPEECSIWGSSSGPPGRDVGKLHAFSLRVPDSEEEQFDFAIYNPERLAVVSATRLRGLRFWSAQTGRPLTEALLTEG